MKHVVVWSILSVIVGSSAWAEDPAPAPAPTPQTPGHCAAAPPASPFSLMGAENPRYVQDTMKQQIEARASALDKAGDKAAAASCRECGNCAPTK